MLAIFFLIIANVSSHQSKEIQEEVHRGEIRKLENLRKYPILNTNYTTLEVNVTYKYKITRTQDNRIYAQGYFGNNAWLVTEWTFNPIDEQIRLFFSCSKSPSNREKVTKTIIVNKSDTIEMIVRKIIELTKTI
jgi:hypothetical protein